MDAQLSSREALVGLLKSVMFMSLFSAYSYFSVSSYSYQWTVLSILDNYTCNFVNGINLGFPLRVGFILIDYELSRLIQFPVSPTDKVQQCTYLAYK